MTTATATATISDIEHKRQLTRAIIASTVGTSIEWYDFFLYGIITGLVFGKLYFPGADPLIGTLQAFSVYAIGFVARPIGAAIFGHYGDRIGRRRTLIITLLLMGLSTCAVAIVPTYDQIGIWGAVILTVLRFLQGVGVGGDWGGSVVLAMEWAKGDKHRGFIASWPQFGVPMGLFLANLVVLATSAWAGDDFLIWAWRIPFFVSLILLLFGLYIRLGVVETPTFRKLQEENKLEKTPILEVIKRQPKEIIVSAFCRLAENSCFYIFTAFILFYGTEHLHLSRDFLLQAVLAASVLAFFMIPLSGWLSDRIGRKKVYIAGIIVTGIFSLVYFTVLDAATPAVAFFIIFISLVPHDIMYGPQAALIAESFTGRLRYSGASLGYQLAAIIAGGPAPIIATALVAKYGSGTPVGIYLFLCAVGSLIATLFLKDRTNVSIAKEYDEA